MFMFDALFLIFSSVVPHSVSFYSLFYVLSNLEYELTKLLKHSFITTLVLFNSMIRSTKIFCWIWILTHSDTPIKSLQFMDDHKTSKVVWCRLRRRYIVFKPLMKLKCVDFLLRFVVRNMIKIHVVEFK